MHRSLRPIGLVFSTIVLVSLALVATAGTATAEDEEYGKLGAYVMFNPVGGLDVNLRPDPADLQGGGGFNTRLGWRETERLAWEVEFEWVIFDGVDDSVWTYGLNGKFYFTQGRIQPYLVLGANGMTRKAENRDAHFTDWGFRTGLGYDYYLTEKWAVNLECTYVAGVGDLLYRDYASFSLGAMYRF